MGKDWRLRKQIEDCYRARGKRQLSDSELDAKLRREWKPEGWDRTKRTAGGSDNKPRS